MRLQAARVKAIEKAAAVATRREPRAIAYVEHADGRLEVPRADGWQSITQAEIDEISAEPGSLVIKLACAPNDAEAFGNAV